MESKEEQLQQIDLDIESAKVLINRKKSVELLINNPQFKEIITEGYFEKEASRLALMTADPNMLGDEDQRELFSAIKAIGHLRQYFLTITTRGKMAEQALDSYENERELIEQE